MDATERLNALQRNRKQYPNGAALDFALKNDETLRREIECLSRVFLRRSVHGCINCYTDAYFELLTITPKMATEKEQCIFRLRAGALVKDINGDRSKMMSNLNITNELALYHLRTNPSCRRFFDRPEDIDAAVAAFSSAKTDTIVRHRKAKKQ